MVIALCGRSGSGKSTVSAELQKCGAYVIDADKTGKNIMRGEVLKKIENAFPDCFSDGELNRRLLAEKVFSDKSSLGRLNAITHPEIRRKIIDEIRINSGKYEIIIVDAAVLIEAGMADIADFKVAVTAPDDVRRRRITLRDNISDDSANMRISAQNSDDFYISNTDYSVVNDGTVPVSDLARDILERSADFAKSK